MLSKLFQRFDPDLYRVKEGENTLGEAETTIRTTTISEGALTRGPDRMARDKTEISVGSLAPAENL
jgi:hypothetical protein